MKLFDKSKRLGIVAALAVSGAMIATPVIASHSWSNYHWLRTSAELTIPVYKNVTANWDSYVNVAVADWNQSTVINSPLLVGRANPKTCKGVAGTIQVCNAAYGRTGWLGIASISLAGGHISQGTTKLNDTYFNTAQYSDPAWKSLVTCQEIGHDYGLGHQDEDFNTDLTNSCMDYTSLPGGNEHPDAHDYEQLLTIYGHTESGMIAGGGATMGLDTEPGDTPAAWGRAIHFDKQGRPDVFERIDAPGRKTITHVFWALGEGPRGNHID
jgi:hypothetical protein